MSKRGKESKSIDLPRVPASILAAMGKVELRQPLLLHARKPRKSKSGRTRRDMGLARAMRYETTGSEALGMILPRDPLERLLRTSAGRSSASSRHMFAAFLHDYLNRVLRAGAAVKRIGRDCRSLMPRHLFSAMKAVEVMGCAPPGSFPTYLLEAGSKRQ
jgi:hypothetical protein